MPVRCCLLLWLTAYARRHASDRRFTFGTGKLGDLAGLMSAILLAMTSLLIGYEAVTRFISPVPIHFDEAIPDAVLGLIVNVATVLLLSGGEHPHGRGHGHTSHAHHHEDAGRIEASGGALLPENFEEGEPPRFRLSWESGRELLVRFRFEPACASRVHVGTPLPSSRP
jgi:Co/Zn/Cd efflux system component